MTEKNHKIVLAEAEAEGNLFKSSMENILEYLQIENAPEWMCSSIEELIDQKNWTELNDRFHSQLVFGTGGMRGRTIGKFITSSERGKSQEHETPQYAAVGVNTLNEITVLRATKALYKYTEGWLREQGIAEKPRLVVAHDVRHFSERFCKLVSAAWIKMGGYSMIFDGPRSTPQLSFSVRHRYAHAGVVITASHNPSHDNGFKAYFGDGAQLVTPHAEGVVEKYKNVKLHEVANWLNEGLDEKGAYILETEDDLVYRAALEDAVLDAEVLMDYSPKIVFTPIHGTGAITAVPALWNHGVDVVVVDKQNKQDANFSTVESPNPENPEALKLGISTALKTKSSLVLGSDPDCDRIGVAAKNKHGKFVCLSGNQVACLLADYRISVLKRNQLLTEANSPGFAMMKTFVTTPMLDKIASAAGIRCINTPTGFKWMAKKLAKYEQKAASEIKQNEGIGIDMDATDLFTRIEILSRYSSYVVLSAEESYGYLPLDVVRDKDGNASALSIAELQAHLQRSKSDVFEYLDQLYSKYGYHSEKTENIYFEGAEGKKLIEGLAETYRSKPLTEIDGSEIVKTKDFREKGFLDEDEDPLPRENFLLFYLANGHSVAVRPSGTEPKIKYYLFGAGVPGDSDLEGSKQEVDQTLENIGKWIRADVDQRVADLTKA